MKKFILTYIFTMACCGVFAQAIFEKNLRIEQSEQVYRLADKATSMVLDFGTGVFPSNAKVVADRDTFLLRKDSHSDKNTSDLLIFRKPLTEVQFLGLEGKPFILKSIYVEPLVLPLAAIPTRVGDDCTKPLVVSASVWRQGLTPPKELPVATQATHLIVHHTAGSNAATNYTDVVRNIYVFHTQTNGWNDVGYNFLIAQDGTIFEGRDGQTIMEGDNVLGAHFCGTNRGTMGVSLLGDYMALEPPTKALESLVKILAWKAKKENLLSTILSSAFHASSGRTLNIISGHRDGCSTDCPGDRVYARLNEIRTNSSTVCQGGVVVLASETEVEKVIKVFPNPTASSIEVTFSPDEKLKNAQVEILDLNGKVWITSDLSTKNSQTTTQLDLDRLSSGRYFLRIIGQEKAWVKAILKH